jgi:pantothenate kinase
MKAVKTSTVDELLALLGNLEVGKRQIVGIAGPPGSGKSTLAEKLEHDLNARLAGYAAVLPMDGFHFDDQVLIPRGLRPSKGAPETFDVDGFAHMLERLRSNRGSEIAVPVFDRSLEIARAGARMVARSVRLIIVEGNYLLLNRNEWNALHFDMTVMLDVPRAILRDRLVERWLKLGRSAEEIKHQVDGNDMMNVDLVQGSSKPSDYLLVS